jgi:hypothetical protein
MGCPQGSACGPHFWKIYYDDLLEIQLDDNQFIEGFADDTCIGIRAKTITELERNASYVLEKVCKWAETSKLKFNPQKTQCVLFTKNYKFTAPNIHFTNHKLEISNSFKHLGLYLDSKLNWNKHCDYIRTKAYKILNKLLLFAKKIMDSTRRH